MKRVAFCVLLMLLATAGVMSAVALANDPPGQGECNHGNSNKPCKPDPQPEHGKDCEEHGPKNGGVNEDHCKGTTTDSTDTTTTHTTTHETTTTGTTTSTTPTTPTTPNDSTTIETTTTEETTTTAPPAAKPPVMQPKPQKPHKRHTASCNAPAYMLNGQCVRDFKGHPHAIIPGQG